MARRSFQCPDGHTVAILEFWEEEKPLRHEPTIKRGSFSSEDELGPSVAWEVVASQDGASWIPAKSRGNSHYPQSVSARQRGRVRWLVLLLLTSDASDSVWISQLGGSNRLPRVRLARSGGRDFLGF
jgi:hypothetical protein